MELVRRTFIPRRSGDLQLLLAPYNSSNYPQESLSLVPQDPRTSHASVWMYLERIPLLVHAPGLVAASDSDARVTLADLAPTTAQLIGFDGWPDDRDGSPLPLSDHGIDEAPAGRRDVRDRRRRLERAAAFPDDWPNLRALMGESANFRNAIVGSFPAVTACAHATIGTGAFPNAHGITGHNLRDARGRRAQGLRRTRRGATRRHLDPDARRPLARGDGRVGRADRLPGLAPRHAGLRRTRPSADDLPVGVFWDEDGTRRPGSPTTPSSTGCPASMPTRDDYAALPRRVRRPGLGRASSRPSGASRRAAARRSCAYQGDVIEAALRSPSRSGNGATDLLYTTYKSPDYTGHVYGMGSKWTGLQLRAVDAELGRADGRCSTNASPTSTR